MSSIKDTIRKILVGLPFAISKNIGVDQLTFKIIKQNLKDNSNCIDVGCHKGEIMDYIIKCAPNGHHHGFEPIPDLYDRLLAKYKSTVSIYPYALSYEAGTSSFNLVTTNLAYSGLIKRKYDREESDTTITVEVKRLDDVLPSDIRIDFIKIDTEGGEYGVLKGAESLIRRCKPMVLFEHGMGASEYYGTKPEMMFQFFESLDMHIFLLDEMLKDNPKPLDRAGFDDQFYNRKSYIFIAK
jgi:FkbM family methyltransferase